MYIDILYTNMINRQFKLPPVKTDQLINYES